MGVENLQIKEFSGTVSLFDSYGNERDFASIQQVELYSTICVKENSFMKIHIAGLGDVELNANDKLFVDESLLSQESFLNSSEISSDTLSLYFTSLVLDQSFLSETNYMDFSSLQEEVTTINDDIKVDIRDLFDLPAIETKIFSNETHSVELNQNEWQKHDGFVFEDGHTFELYSKNGSGDEVFTLLIEDSISIIDTQG